MPQLPRLRNVRAVSWVNVVGMTPSTLVEEISTSTRAVMAPMLLGMEPVSEFSVRCSNVKAVMLPKEAGILPPSWFPLRSNTLSAGNKEARRSHRIRGSRTHTATNTYMQQQQHQRD